MITYLRKLLDGGSTFTVTLLINGGSYGPFGVLEVDRVGILMENECCEIAYLWHHIQQVSIDVTERRP